VKKSFNIQELLHHKSKRHETKLMHPSSSRAFKRDQEHDLKASWFGGSHRYKQNKTNKLPSFKDRLQQMPFQTILIKLGMFTKIFDAICKLNLK